MLLNLHVKNLALIDEEEIEFSDGLNILTGETGAGKSIIIGSIGLALGGKGDRDLIRAGAEYALIELLFRTDSDQQTRLLTEMDLPVEEDGTILIKRKLMPTRSVFSVNGETVTAKQLRDLSEVLLDVYGQRENQRLLRREQQLMVIDEFAGKESEVLRAQIGKRYRELRQLLDEWENGDPGEAARRREADLLTYEIQEIEEAALKDGEDKSLEQQYRMMTNFRRISESVASAEQLIGGSSYGGSSYGADAAAEQITRACRELNAIADLDETLSQLAAQLSDIDNLISDFSRGISDYERSLSFDPQEFQAVEERLDLINHLKDKYGRTIEAVRTAQAERSDRLAELEDFENHRAQLEKEISLRQTELTDLCAQLTEIRRTAAEDFSVRMRAELLDLNFNQVQFEVRLQPLETESGFSANGADRVTMYISMNPGEPLRPLDEIASGGELSRIMLALKTVFAGKEDIYTFIFDEIDSGISGQTAWKVAQKLGRLSRDHQLLCITHLPQIAAMEDAHYLIEKVVSAGSQNSIDAPASDGTGTMTGSDGMVVAGHTATHIRRLSDEESTRELARMMGGELITQSTLENAAELKNQAVSFRAELL